MTEEPLHIAVADFLRAALPLDAVFHHSPNEGRHTKGYRARQLRKGMRPGWPDLEVLHDGSMLFFEAKTPQGSLSVAQRRCHADIEAAGGFVTTVRSVDEVEMYLRMCGVPLRASVAA